MGKNPDPASFPEALISLRHILTIPEYLHDLSIIERKIYQIEADRLPIPNATNQMIPNPTVTLIPVSWQNLPSIIDPEGNPEQSAPAPRKGHVIVWRQPDTCRLVIRDAENSDLLALKIIVDEIDPLKAASEGKVSPGHIDGAVNQAVAKGILIAPPSKIRRHPDPSVQATKAMTPFLSADGFTLQWHITQACDLHCRHCYDRRDRDSLPFDSAVAVLDDLYRFCKKMHVKGHVSFTGGNPLLYPRFEEIYREAAARGFSIAILGNPAPIQLIEELAEILKPAFYQISLEGLETHNDFIRGAGHFKKSIEFLEKLKAIGIYSMVMLTLTRDNIDQVLDLGDYLAGKADSFTFNRLSAVGEGADLRMPSRDEFEPFLRAYDAAAATNPVLALKDNLFNIIRDEKCMPLFGGCTGFGCGAAFNFLALLPDGEVHACRKFPSPIGDIRRDSLSEIYASELAERYRCGSAACLACRLTPVCRGCSAVVFSSGKDIFTERDPFCFAPQTLWDGP